MISNKDLRLVDPEAYASLKRERKRQEDNIELIASENFVSNAIREAAGSILTNKYAEGYPHKRYYGGCSNIDEIESLAIERAKKLFNCKWVNVQPHSGSSANMAAFRALLKHGDKVLGMSLDAGGHLTHGYHLSFSGQDYEAYFYGVNPETGLIDYDEVLKIAKEVKPRLIICGASSYPRIINFKRFREIADEVNAYLLVDMAHIAGLVATGDHPSPLPYADVVTTTTHKTLRGPRGGMILSNNEELGKLIDKAVFPACQGGPLEHIILGKAIMLKEAMDDSYKVYIKQVIKNTHALVDSLKEEKVKIITDGSDNHLLLMDVKTSFGLTGLKSQKILEECNITTNKNSIPNDQERPAYCSGLRLGTPAMTTRGYKEEDFYKVGKLIVSALKDSSKQNINHIKKEVKILNKKYPLPYEK